MRKPPQRGTASLTELPQQSPYAPQHRRIVIDDENKVPNWATIRLLLDNKRDRSLASVGLHRARPFCFGELAARLRGRVLAPQLFRVPDITATGQTNLDPIGSARDTDPPGKEVKFRQGLNLHFLHHPADRTVDPTTKPLLMGIAAGDSGKISRLARHQCRENKNGDLSD